MATVGLSWDGRNKQERMLNALESATDTEALDAADRLCEKMKRSFERYVAADEATVPDDQKHMARAVHDLRSVLRRHGYDLDAKGRLTEMDDPPSPRPSTTFTATPQPAADQAVGASAPSLATHTPGDRMAAEPDARSIFLVHGRDHRVKKALVELLTSFDLLIVEWEEAAAQTGTGSPSTLDVVLAGMELARGVVVLFTPDDVAYCKPEFVTDTDPSYEHKATGQARQNVMFEAGMALGIAKKRTVLVRHGAVREASDLAGINYLPIDDTDDSRLALGQRLRNIGLAVKLDHNRWRRAGRFAADDAGTGDGDPTSQPEPPPASPTVNTATTHQADIESLLAWVYDPTERGKLDRLVLGRVAETDQAVNRLDMHSVESSQLPHRYQTLRDLSVPVLALLLVAVENDPEVSDRALWQTALMRLLRIRKRIAKQPNSLVQSMPGRWVECSRHLPAMLALRTIGLAAILFESDHPGPRQPPTQLWRNLGRLQWADPNSGPYGTNTRPRSALDLLDEHEVLDPTTVHAQDQSGRFYTMSRYARALLRPVFATLCPDDEDWEQLNDQFEYRRALIYAYEALPVPPMLAGGEQRWTTFGWRPEREFLENSDRTDVDSPWADIVANERFDAILEEVRSAARRHMPI